MSIDWKLDAQTIGSSCVRVVFSCLIGGFFAGICSMSHYLSETPIGLHDVFFSCVVCYLLTWPE